MQVLIIDDEPALRQLLTASLTRAGHAVDEAGSAAQAAARLARGDVDLALCDIKLGDGNGGILFVGDNGKILCNFQGGNPQILPESKMKEFKE